MPASRQRNAEMPSNRFSTKHINSSRNLYTYQLKGIYVSTERYIPIE